MASEQAIEQCRAGSGQPEKKNRPGFFVDFRSRFEKGRRAGFDQSIHLVPRLFRGPWMQGAHHGIAFRQRLPRLVVTANVLQFLVTREFKRGVIWRTLRHQGSPATEIVQVIVIGCLLAQARQFQRRGARRRVHPEARLEIGFRFPWMPANKEFQTTGEPELGAVDAQPVGAIQQPQGCVILAQFPAHAGVIHHDRPSIRLDQGRVFQAGPRREGFSDTEQSHGDRNDRHRFCRRVACCVQRVPRGIAHPAVRPCDVTQRHVGCGVPWLPLQQCFEHPARCRRLARTHENLGPAPQLINGLIDHAFAKRWTLHPSIRQPSPRDKHRRRSATSRANVASVEQTTDRNRGITRPRNVVHRT
ncbi:MAG TPA: hypothetical protein VJ823_01980 [Rhodanobacteraceae bacterium]|nr:hypothetical protein [Rhodanobacteraceae bacterium]